MWTLKYDTNEPIYETKTESGHREQTVGCPGEGGGRGMDWELGTRRWKQV